MLSVCVCVCVWREREKDWGLIVNSNLDTNSNQPNHDTGATALPAQRLGPRGPAPITISDSIVCCVWEDSGGRCTLYHTCQQTRLAQSCVQEHTHTHTHTHTHVGFYGLRGLSIGVMVFILYKLYVLLPYTYPTPKLSPHRRRCISIFPQKNSLCMIYKRFKLWGHWKCPHKSPSPCNTYVIPMSLYKFVSS